MLIEAHATRTDGLVTVTLIGQSPMPYEAAIIGTYPGTIMQIADPGSAQIFIQEGRKPGFENSDCQPLLGKTWMINHTIHDNCHKTVEIFINGCLVKKIRVLENTVMGMYNIIDL